MIQEKQKEKKQSLQKSKVNKRNNRSKKKSFQLLAEKRINELFSKAEELFPLSPKYSNNCVKLARKIALRYKVSFSKEQKLQFCKKCESYLIPSKTSRLRVSQGKIKILCLNCKHITRYGYK